MAASIYRWSLIAAITVACLATFKCVTEPKDATNPVKADTTKYPDIKPPGPR